MQEIKDRILRSEKIEWKKLKPFQPENLKVMTKESFEILKTNILKRNFLSTFDIWEEEKDVYWILDGHHRKYALEALEKEGHKIPDKFSCNMVDCTDKNDANYVLLSHASSHAKMDELGLSEFIHVNEMDFDELKATMEIPGVDFDRMQAENIDVIEPQCEDDEIPELKVEATTKPGDIWVLGKHRLICGDSTDIDCIDKLMVGERADMVFTDPPYNTGMTSESQKGSGGLWKGNKKGKKSGGSARLSHMFDDAYSEEDWQSFMASFMASFWIVMKDDSVAYICLDWRRNHELIPHILDSGFKRSNLIVWDKMVHGLGSDYKYTHEFINVCKKGNPVLSTHQGEDREYSDVWHIQRKMGKDEDHATKKPIELVDRAIRHASKINDLVVDLFGGSGSTLIACEKTNRKCYMSELNPAYCDVIIKRWEKFTGKKAIHEESQQTFDELSPLV